MKRRSIYEFLKECALKGKSIKECCKEEGISPASVRRFLYLSQKKKYLSHRIVRDGRNIGFLYDGVAVFWDRVEKRREK